MKNQFTIRKAQKKDIGLIVEFNLAMAMETEGRKLKRNEIEPGVQGLFTKPQYGFYLVAEFENVVVGTLMITYEWSDWRNGLLWWIQSVYVIPDFRRKGVYRQMYQYVKNMAKDDPDICGFRLYVEKENERAQKTYSALGMEETPYKIFEEVLDR